MSPLAPGTLEAGVSGAVEPRSRAPFSGLGPQQLELTLGPRCWLSAADASAAGVTRRARALLVTGRLPGEESQRPLLRAGGGHRVAAPVSASCISPPSPVAREGEDVAGLPLATLTGRAFLHLLRRGSPGHRRVWTVGSCTVKHSPARGPHLPQLPGSWLASATGPLRAELGLRRGAAFCAAACSLAVGLSLGAAAVAPAQVSGKEQ